MWPIGGKLITHFFAIAIFACTVIVFITVNHLRRAVSETKIYTMFKYMQVFESIWLE